LPLLKFQPSYNESRPKYPKAISLIQEHRT